MPVPFPRTGELAYPVDVTSPPVLRAFSAWRRTLRRARDDFAAFAPLVAKDDQGNPIQYVQMHRAWVHHLSYCWDRGLYCAIMAHFGSGKSSGFAIPLVSWLVGRDQNIRIKYISHSDALAARAVSGAKTLIESPVYKAVFPGVKIGHKWSEHEAFVVRSGWSIDPTIHAQGVDSKGVGGRADVLFFDDVVDEKNAESQEQRDKVKKRVHRTWMSRLADPAQSRVLWIATPWHIDDATMELLTMPRWCTLVQKVNDDCSALEQEVIGADADYLHWGSMYKNEAGVWVCR